MELGKPETILYVGSTIRSLVTRWGEHISDAKTRCNSKLYRYIRARGIEHFTCVLLEAAEFNTRTDMLIREEHHRALHQTPLNSIRCSRGKNIQEHLRQKYILEKDKRIAYVKMVKICECGVPSNNGGIYQHRKSKKHKRCMKRLAAQLLDEIIAQLKIHKLK